MRRQRVGDPTNKAALHEIYRLTGGMIEIAEPTIVRGDYYINATDRKRLVDRATRLLEATLRLTKSERGR